MGSLTVTNTPTEAAKAVPTPRMAGQWARPRRIGASAAQRIAPASGASRIMIPRILSFSIGTKSSTA